MEAQDLSNSHLFTYRQETLQISRPFFETSEVGVFSFVRVYADNHYVTLSTFPEPAAENYRNKSCMTYKRLHALMRTNKRINRLRNHFYLLPREDNHAAYQLAEKYGIHNLIVLTEKIDDYFDCFCFSTKNKKNILGYYFNNWDILIRFKHIFLDKAEKIIKRCEKDKLLVKFDKSLPEKQTQANNKDTASDRLTPDRYYVNTRDRRVKITAREFMCLKCLGQGRTMKEAAIVLGIAERTVQNYQETLKRKFSVYSRSQLIDIYLSSDLSVI